MQHNFVRDAVLGLGERAVTFSPGRLLLLFPMLIAAGAAAAVQFDIPAPAASGAFGSRVTFLANGNIVVTDPTYDAPGPVFDVGAVYLFGPDGQLISALTGSSAGDQVGSGGITVLANGNYVVRSPLWNNGSAEDAGAATWVNGATGLAGQVSAANSLVGGSVDDRVGTDVVPLPNGNYVVRNILWSDGAIRNVGAVTWANGATGRTGDVSGSNSLIGSTENDQVGFEITILTNGNYVVMSPVWDNGSVPNAGAVTWANGDTGRAGRVTAANSVVGSSPDDRVGSRTVARLGNGNYVVRSPLWDRDGIAEAGAATWGDGTAGTSGAVSVENSLVGSSPEDRVGAAPVTPLAGGNYVVSSPMWDSASVVDVGAATWGDGTTGIAGEISASNSLVGSRAADQVASAGVTAFGNGNYVVVSPEWNNGDISAAGAVTWANGTIGLAGPISGSNSLVGSSPGDRVGSSAVAALVNGNYVVASPTWDNGATPDTGAATWGDGAGGIAGEVAMDNSLVGDVGDRIGSAGVTALANGNYLVRSPTWNADGAAQAGAVTLASGSGGTVGVVSPENSLVGVTAFDQVGQNVVALTNGNYVARSSSWDNGAIVDAGAVTWGHGVRGVVGEVSIRNSLVGSSTSDRIGFSGVSPLANGNFVVGSPLWDDGGNTQAGAATWGNGKTGIRGEISAANSLIGSSSDDKIGDLVFGLSDGNYVVIAPLWDNGAIINAGAVTLGQGSTGTVGPLTMDNSVLSQVPNQIQFFGLAYNAARQALAVARSAEDLVTILLAEQLFSDGFE